MERGRDDLPVGVPLAVATRQQSLPQPWADEVVLAGLFDKLLAAQDALEIEEPDCDVKDMCQPVIKNIKSNEKINRFWFMSVLERSCFSLVNTHEEDMKLHSVKSRKVQVH